MTPRILSLVLLLATAGRSEAQTIGVDICSCAPSTYEFTLDFDLFCPPVNVTQGDAVLRTGCLVNPVIDPEVDDLIPVAVNSIDVVELDQDLSVIVQENIEGSFGSGDTFSYTSFAANPGNIIDSRDLPKAIQVNIYGVNDQDEALVNSWIIQFTNNCGAFPVLFEGQSAGWVRFSDLTPPRPEFCPETTLSPVAPPTVAPVTQFPTRSPVVAPTREPTQVTASPVAMSMSMSMLMDLDLDGMAELVDREFGATTRVRKGSKTKSAKSAKLKESKSDSKKSGKKSGKRTKRAKKSKQNGNDGSMNGRVGMDSEDIQMDSEDIAILPTERGGRKRARRHRL